MPLAAGGPQPRRHERRGERVDRTGGRSGGGHPCRDRSADARWDAQEIRLHPSTYNTASIGGFIAGGSGGVGSINWGGLRDLGNVLRLRVVTMEAQPRILDLSGWDLQKVMHAYGTNGIITEVEVPLDAAYDWVDVMVGFDDYLSAVRFADSLANQDGLLFKEIATVAAPLPHDYFLRHQKFLRRDQSAALLMVAPHAMDPFLKLAERERGELLFRSDLASESDIKGLPPIFELAWNHTTLRGLRVDPTVTYLQVLYPFPSHVESVARMTELFGDELPGHLEFIRFDGKVCCAGLPIVRFTTEERLDEIIRIHEENGCPVFNPHRYTLEEGGMKQTDAVQLAFKREADPEGLLNPGKMIAWTIRISPTLPARAISSPALKPRADPAHACPRPLRPSRGDELRLGAPSMRRRRIARGRARRGRLRSLCGSLRPLPQPGRAASLSRRRRQPCAGRGPRREVARGRGAGSLLSGLELRIPGDPERLPGPCLPAGGVV
jgi:hypothetical protein